MSQTMATSLSAIANAGVTKNSIQKRAALPQSSCVPSLSRCNVVQKSAAQKRSTLKSRAGIVCASIRRSECVEESQAASPEPTSSATDGSFFLERALLFSAAMLTPMVTGVGEAAAAGGQFGILEGKSVALLHPAGMLFFFGYTLYAGYLGYQYRRIRTIGDEISALKKTLPAPVEGAPVSQLEQQIASLTEERKSLTKGGFRDKHFDAGSLLLGGGVFLGVAGCLNTYTRTGKLFPGPHLYAGAGIVVLWALAASLVPSMTKGNSNARNAHIALNVLNVGLFAWQIPTGWEIVEKVFVFAPWP